MRLRTTHAATVYGDRTSGENAVGEDRIVSDVPLITIPCRYRPQGNGFTRERREPRIDRSPEIVVPPRGRHPENGEQVSVSGTIGPGQRVDISDVDTVFYAMRIDPHFGHSGAPDRFTIELESDGDE